MCHHCSSFFSFSVLFNVFLGCIVCFICMNTICFVSFGNYSGGLSQSWWATGYWGDHGGATNAWWSSHSYYMLLSLSNRYQFSEHAGSHLPPFLVSLNDLLWFGTFFSANAFPIPPFHFHSFDVEFRLIFSFFVLWKLLNAFFFIIKMYLLCFEGPSCHLSKNSGSRGNRVSLCILFCSLFSHN